MNNNKHTLVIILLALISMTASAIDACKFHSGTAVLKGRIQNKPSNEWNIVTVSSSNLFTDQEEIHTIPVTSDGSFERTIPLTCSQSVMVQDMGFVFLAVGDTVEVTKDAGTPEGEGMTISGRGTSVMVNQFWPVLKKHYFGDEELFIKDLPMDKIPAWKKEMVALIDKVIADIEAARLPLPSGTDSCVAEILGARLLAEPFLAIMQNYRYNMTGGTYLPRRDELGDYYDFLAGREKWLLDNPAMLFVEDVNTLVNRVEYYMMPDFIFMSNSNSLNLKKDDDVGYYQLAVQTIKSRYGIESIGCMGQIALCHHVFKNNDDDEFSPDKMSSVFAAAIPHFSHPVVAYHALQAYRKYVKRHEGHQEAVASSSPEGDAIFQRIVEPYKGNALYIDFWGMSCGPCRRNMLDERGKVERMKDLPVRFLYICDEKESPRANAEQWMQDNAIKGEHIYVTHEEWQHLSTKFQFHAIPFGLALDKTGNVVTQNDLNNYFEEQMKSE